IRTLCTTNQSRRRCPDTPIPESQCWEALIDWKASNRSYQAEVRGSVPRPLGATEQHSRNQNRADVGVGSGPGGPPDKSSQAAKSFRSSSIFVAFRTRVVPKMNTFWDMARA